MKHWTPDPELIALIDEALGRARREAPVPVICDALVTGFRRGLAIPPEESRLRPRARSSYQRHELHRSNRFGYALMHMVWPPGSATPLHDHDGAWCVELIVAGCLEVTLFHPEPVGGSDFTSRRFRPSQPLLALPGQVLGLDGPEGFHVCRNPSQSQVCETLHVYAHPLERMRVFEREGDGRWRGHLRRLSRMETVGTPAQGS